jgi:hypothetical protein
VAQTIRAVVVADSHVDPDTCSTDPVEAVRAAQEGRGDTPVMRGGDSVEAAESWRRTSGRDLRSAQWMCCMMRQGRRCTACRISSSPAGQRVTERHRHGRMRAYRIMWVGWVVGFVSGIAACGSATSDKGSLHPHLWQKKPFG